MKYATLALCGLMWFGCSQSASNSVDGSTSGEKTFDPCVSDPKPGFDPASHGLAKCCDSGPAHCVPSDEVIDKLAMSLDACPDGKSVCMPDPIIKAGGQFKPASCTSSVGNSAGVCLSQCIPLVYKNPQSALLGQDGCGDGELCVPCLNPLNGTSTGACDLDTLLCSTDDGGVDGGGDGGQQACPYTGPPLLDPSTLGECDPMCGGAHCLPAALVPAAQQSLLQACTTPGGPGFCTPDKLIETAGNFVPKSCTSVAGAEGRCLSSCLAVVSAEAAVLSQDVCDGGELCVPCYNPTATDPTLPTGACNLACDQPVDPPLMLTCPWTGPAIVEPTRFPACDDSCYGSHCVPTSLVPASLQSMLAVCGGGSGFCTPDNFITGAGNSIPKSCTSLAGAEGRCLSKCLPEVAAKDGVLPSAGCDMNELCVPCYDPTAPSPQPATGACNLACDKPAMGPVEIMCPYTGPNLLDPMMFPDCSSATCTNAHCLPAAQVPLQQQSLLAKCVGGGFCTPDQIIGSLDNFVPKSCTSIGGYEGRCMSTCIPAIASQSDVLNNKGCEDQPGTLCAPCFDPTSPSPQPATGACSLGCDKPASGPPPIKCPYTGPDLLDPTMYPSCATASCTNAHCLPDHLVPDKQKSLLTACAGGGYCTPDPIISSLDNFVPTSCRSVAGVEGRCVSTCLPSVNALKGILPSTGCDAGTVCAPCYNPTSTDWNVETGACDIGCDRPQEPPTQLMCPWNGPAVIDPNMLPTCGCTGAHCLPSDFVPAADQSQLNTCTGGYCTPDAIIRTGGNFKPPGCIPFAGVTTTAEGRCLSDCLPAVQSQTHLETSSCTGTDKCAPCADPFTGADTSACHLSSCDSAPTPVFKFPNCCIHGGVPSGRCVPKSQIPSSQLSLVQPDECGNINSNYECVPDENLPAPYGTPGKACSSGYNFFRFLNMNAYTGTCLSNCLNFPLGTGLKYDSGDCPANYTCIGCADAPSGSTGCP